MKASKHSLQFEVTSETPQPTYSEKYTELYKQLPKIPAGKNLKVTAADTKQAVNSACTIRSYCKVHGLSFKVTTRGNVIWISSNGFEQ